MYVWTWGQDTQLTRRGTQAPFTTLSKEPVTHLACNSHEFQTQVTFSELKSCVGSCQPFKPHWKVPPQLVKGQDLHSQIIANPSLFWTVLRVLNKITRIQKWKVRLCCPISCHSRTEHLVPLHTPPEAILTAILSTESINRFRICPAGSHQFIHFQKPLINQSALLMHQM